MKLEMPKLRSLPNFKTASRYIDAFATFIAFLGIYNLVSICLIQDDFMPTFPTVFAIVLLLRLIHVYSTIENEYRYYSRDKVQDVVVHIRLKHHQALKEKLADNPELLNAKYDNRSLLAWAKHYKNREANSIIIQRLRSLKK